MGQLDAARLVPGLLVIAAAAVLVFRKVDVRLVLLPAALLLGVLGGRPQEIARTFFASFADSKFVVPICCSMGFAHVLKLFECNRHLVVLLTRPLRRVRRLLIPGTVLAGFLVNVPIISQASTAAAIGPVLIPLMLAAGLSRATAGAALLLGTSVGGELLNPGAPEYATVTEVVNDLAPGATPLRRSDCVVRTLPFNLLQFAVATAVFWFLSARAERRALRVVPAEPPEAEAEPALDRLRVNWAKAAIPLVPLAILFLTARLVRPDDPSRFVQAFEVPRGWLVDAKKDVGDARAASAQKRASELFDARLIGAAMLIGSAAAACTGIASARGRAAIGQAARAFFDGAGYAFKEIIAITISATCFADGVKLIGIGALVERTVQAVPWLLLPLAGLLTLAFAFLSGSGFAATQSLFGTFAAPAHGLGIDPVRVGSLTALGAAAGRTMSPAAAVNLMCARLSGAETADLVRRVALPLLAGAAAAILLALAR